MLEQVMPEVLIEQVILGVPGTVRAVLVCGPGTDYARRLPGSQA